MYPVNLNGKTVLEADACGIGFLASRKGVADRRLVELALHLATQFDHRGAPGHGAGVQLDIPWPLLIDRFSEHTKLIAQRDVALGMMFLPFDAPLRRRCVEMVEELADLAGSRVLAWADVPMDPGVLDPKSGALRTLPVVRQALFQRPVGLSEDGWFTCRYLLRLALETQLGDAVGDEFAIASLSNRTVVYKGLGELSTIGRLYPDLSDPHTASKFVLFHSRYCTNTTTAWRRAQPFWAIAHNGEIATIAGNVAWMDAIGRDLIRRLIEKHPSLERIAGQVGSIVNPGGSDSANLDDMVIALIAGGMSLPQAILALLPEAQAALGQDSRLQRFYQSMSTFLGACDGPAAIVTCDGDHAVAHLDRNGLRPLWIGQTKDYVVAASELTGNLDVGEFEVQRLMGPGETVVVNLNSGDVLLNEDVHHEVARRSVPDPTDRTIEGRRVTARLPIESPELTRMELAFGMSKEDLDVILEPLIKTGKPALGSMGDDTSPAALLDATPRRLEDYFALRFAQETSPPIDPVRDAWVFDVSVMLGDRGGLWSKAEGQIFGFPSRVLAAGEVDWLRQQDGVHHIPLLVSSSADDAAIESAMESVIEEACRVVPRASVLVLSDRFPSSSEAPLQPLRVISRLHHRLVSLGIRHRVGLVADVGVWDIHQVALLVTMGADAVCPWIGCAVAGEAEAKYLEGVRTGFMEVMSMMGVTPSSAYCGARLAEAVGLCADFLKEEFPGVPGHLGGIGREVIAREWRGFYDAAFAIPEEDREEAQLPDVGEFRHTKNGRRHANNAEIVRSLHTASGYAAKIHGTEAGSWEAYRGYAKLVSERPPLTPLDCLQLKPATPIPLDEVEGEETILWRFMAPGMSEGALSEPAHRAVARGMNTLYRYVRLLSHLKGRPVPSGFGPFANSGEGGFSKERIHNHDRNRSVQYAGGRFTITPMTAACAEEAEVKFAQGAKPGKGGQLPGKKVSERIAHQRGCEPGYELVSPPINHNLYSIEDVKLMLESWRHLNPNVNCALKFVATYGVEMVCQGGVNAGANRLHISDGCGGTGAAKRVDQKHAGVPAAAVLPVVQDLLVESDVRHLVELSCDGGVQNGEQALKLMLLGADRVGFGTSLLIAIGCSMLRKCHLSGPDLSDPTGKRRLGCTPGVATQDPQFVARFTGSSKHVARMLRFVAREIREKMAAHGIRKLDQVIGRRDFLERKPGLEGKAALLDLGVMLRAPHRLRNPRAYAEQTARHMPALRTEEREAAERSVGGERIRIEANLTNVDRCVGLGAAGIIARAKGDLGLSEGSLSFHHTGAAGHFYAAYSVGGMDFRLLGLAADSCFTAAYGGKLVVVPQGGRAGLTVVGNTFAYGARGGRAFLAGAGGNRFGICLRKNHEGGGPVIVVEGVEANAFQYMTGGTAVVLGRTGYNLGSGLTGGRVFLLDVELRNLNADYVQALAVSSAEAAEIRALIEEHLSETGSQVAAALLAAWDPSRFVKVVTRKLPESVDFYGAATAAPEPVTG